MSTSFSYYTDSLCQTHFINITACTYSTAYWSINGAGYSASEPVLNMADGNYIATLYVAYHNNPNISSITYTISVSCNSATNTPTSCQAYFYAYTDSLCVTHFINTSVSYGGSNTSQWSINGNVYTTSDVALNLPDGAYSVSLNNYSNGGFCDSITRLISVNCSVGDTTAPLGCQVYSQFSVFADSTNSGNYFAYNYSSGTGTVFYAWDFGDGTTSNQQYPFHQYATPGHYIICLTVLATSGTTTCTSSYCDSSSVTARVSGFLMSQLNVVAQNATGIKQTEILTHLNAYPNPMTEELAIEASTKDNSKLKYSLIDALGRIVLSGSIENSKAIINTSSLEKGFYSLSITNEKGSSLKAVKLVK